MTNKLFLKKPLYLIFSASIISIVLIILLNFTIKLENKFEEKMLNISTSDILSISNNVANFIVKSLETNNISVKMILENKNIQKDLENKLKTLLTNNIKYSYLIYKDKNDIFRFLADASPEAEKAHVNQKFDIDSPKWLEVYEKKEPILIKQSLLKQLSITYLIPVILNNEVEIILVVDFAIEKVEDINKIIFSIKYSIIAIISIISLFIILLIIQTIKYTMIKKSVFIDKLTEVYNRNYLQESETLINFSDYIMAALDIDHFKKINDSYGHIVGDKILKQLAQTITESVRKNDDIIIRYGGEEFLILIKTKRDSHTKALNSLDRIFQNIRNKRFTISDLETIKVTVSIGVNLNPQDSRTFSEAFKLADISLYNAKNKGRNQIEIYTNEQTQTSFLSINDIKHAIDEKRVICYYQKIINTKTAEDSHYEALLRIRTADNKIITPDKILPAIKGTFIARNITIEVLAIAHKKLVKNKNVKINVNLNPIDILDSSILNILKEYATDRDISKRLGIELIETEEIANYDDAKKNLLMLKELGYRIFIDDFGSGYSNFIYLTEIKTDYIKIDGNIIKKILDDKTSYLVVKSIVTFAKEANIKVIAEYVSTKEIYEKIKELEIDYSQGYLFSIPSEDL